MSEVNPIVIADDNQTAFWTPYNGEVGNHRIDIADDAVVKQVGANSLKMTLSPGAFGVVGVYHEYGGPQNWLAEDVISFRWFGAKSGYGWKLGLVCSGWASSFNFYFNDDWFDWKTIVIPKALMEQIGVPTWNSIIYIQVFAVGLPITPAQTTITNLDRLIIDISVPITNYTLTMLTPVGQGTATPQGSTTYPSGTQVNIVATPAQGWVFDHWTLNGASVTGGASASVIMDSDKTLQAYFTQVISGRRILHSAMVNIYRDPAVNIPTDVGNFNSLVGKSILDYSNGIGITPSTWPQDFSVTLGSGVQGVLPFFQSGLLKTFTFSWPPYANYASGATLVEIANGVWDSYLITCANQCKAFGYPMYARLGGEFNICTPAWAKYPADFVAAWKHMVDLFRAQGVTNMHWVWNPNFAGDLVGGAPIENWGPYYPGDDYVDWIGIDMYQYNDDMSWGGANPEREISYFYNYFYSGVNRPKSTKPMGIFEYGTNSYEHTLHDTPDAIRAQWLSAFFDAVESRPEIQLISYFYAEHYKFDVVNHPLTTAVYRNRIANPIYLGNSSIHMLSVEPITPPIIPFTLNGVPLQTPYSALIPDGTYSIAVPNKVIIGG